MKNKKIIITLFVVALFVVGSLVYMEMNVWQPERKLKREFKEKIEKELKEKRRLERERQEAELRLEQERQRLEWERQEKIRLENEQRKFSQIAPEMVKVPGSNFAIGKYEITQDQFSAIMGMNPSTRRGGNRPVGHVLYRDCVRYCSKLTEKAREIKYIRKDQKYRLPTSDEWIIAAKAGGINGVEFDDVHLENLSDSFKELFDEKKASLQDNSFWNIKNSGKIHHPVGTSKPNKIGVYDMLGNVREWTSTRLNFRSNRYVSMGGCYLDHVKTCLSSLTTLEEHTTDYADEEEGFRVILVPAK